jgi:hypothetical protein
MAVGVLDRRLDVADLVNLLLTRSRKGGVT